MTAPRWLDLRLLDSTGAPLAGRAWRLDAPPGPSHRGHLDAAGWLRQPLPPDLAGAELAVAWRRFRLQFGTLEAAETVRGAQARLNQLNFPCGPVDGDAGPRTATALAAFQAEAALPTTGALDPATALALESACAPAAPAPHPAAGAPSGDPGDPSADPGAPSAGAPSADPGDPSAGTAGSPDAVPHPVHLNLGAHPGGAPTTLVVYDWFGTVGTPPRAGNAVQVLVDGEAAWAQVQADLRAARREVRLATWMLRPDHELVRPQPTALADPGARAEARFGATVEALAARGVAVRLLIWGMTGTPLMNRWLRRWYWRLPPHLDLLEQDHPMLIGSHHQKTLTVDGTVGYCGGMNLKENDWDAPEHAVFEPRRMPHHASARARQAVGARRRTPRFLPRHDLMLRVVGPAVGDLDANFVERWTTARRAWRRSLAGRFARLVRRALGQRLPPDLRVQPAPSADPAPSAHPAPDAIPAPGARAEASAAGVSWVQVVRTAPRSRRRSAGARPAEAGILAAYERAIGNAQRLIYIENQYFRSPLIGARLAEALRRNPHLQLIVVAWPVNGGRRSLIDPTGYWTADAQDRVRAVRPEFRLTRLISAAHDARGALVTAPVDVHAKVMIVDDLWLTVGSANLNDRGFKYEGEINAVVVDPAQAGPLRRRLMAEHLHLSPADPRLADPDSACALWAEHARANAAQLARGALPTSAVHPFTQRAWAFWGRLVGAGIF